MTGSSAVWLTAGAFLGTHFILSHPLRAPLVRRMGEGGFSALYSVVAIVTFGATVFAYRAAPVTPMLWDVGNGLWVVATVATLLASILLLGSLIRNPALPGAGKTAASASARGVFSITRHPMMWGFAVWGLAHILIYPVGKNIVLAGAIVVLALVGAAMQDRKKAALDPGGWTAWQARTSVVFHAVRN